MRRSQKLTLWQQARQRGLILLKKSLKTTHSRIMTCGVLVGLFYLPVWLGVLWDMTLRGSSDALLSLGFIYLALRELFERQRQLKEMVASNEDRMLGYLLILGGGAIFPLCLTSISLQAFVCMIIFAGIVLCQWGFSFFQKFSVSALLLLVCIYPNLGYLANTIRRTLAPNQLETFMAWVASLSFRAIGITAVTQNQFLSLSAELDASKAVEVASGCSGFDMAFTLAGVGLILGLFFRQPWSKTRTLIAVAVLLALVTNVPRIMLLAIAVVYWGQESFEFWHGPIGGQIIASLLITIYYYAAMAIIDHKTSRPYLK